MDIADNAHDRGPASFREERAEVYALSDGIKIWPESVSQLFVDKDVAPTIVSLVKQPAIAQWNFHCREISQTNGANLGDGPYCCIGDWLAFDDKSRCSTQLRAKRKYID